MGNRTKITKTRVRKALQEADGIVSVAAEMLGVSKSTIYNYLNRWTGLWDVVQNERDELVHLAKQGLANHLRDKKPPEWAIKFTLTTLDTQFEQKTTVDFTDAKEHLARLIGRRIVTGDSGDMADDAD